MQTSEYFEKVVELLEKIENEQIGNIKKAAKVIADAIERDELIHVYAGGGHTWMGVVEVFYRAGGLVPINPFIDYGLSPFNQALHYMYLERLPGYGTEVVNYYNPKKGEVIIIVHNIGLNPATIDAALECRRRGLKIIAISSSEWHKKVPMDHIIRHPSKKSIFEIADICIDDHNPFGDAVIQLEGVDTPIAPISTITDCYILQRLNIEVAKELVKRGVKPPFWKSANVPGGDEFNKKYIEKYMNRVKYL